MRADIARTFLLATAVAAGLSASLVAQAGGGQAPGGRGAPAPPSGHAAAPWDISGYWTALITDDWRYRMLTPPKGNVDYLPVTGAGRGATNAWDPAKDQAAGEQCKGYGAGGIMRLPGRLHITWENDNELRMDIDTGIQTRRFYFEGAQAASAQAASQSPSLQGYSIARWESPGAGGRGGRGGPPPPPANAAAGNRPGQLRVVTTRLRPGYVRKNGVPYGADTVITEHYVHLVDNDRQEYLALTITVDDPTNFQPAYVKTYQFRKQADAKGWNPTPCSAK